MEKKPTESVEAHTLYLKGVYHQSNMGGDPNEVGKAIEYFKLACEQDPTFALAFAKVAWCYVWIADITMPSKEAIPVAKDYAARALSLDENLPEACYAEAMIANQFDWDWGKTERSFRKALMLNPSLADAHSQYAWFLAMKGRSEEAVLETSLACELDPLSPLTLSMSGFIHWVVGEYATARALDERVVKLAPSFAYGALSLAMLSATEGKFEEAVREADEAAKRSNETWFQVQVAQVYAMAGLKDQARKMLEHLLSKEFSGHASLTFVGATYYLLGEKERGWECMHKAYEAKDTALAMFNRAPTMKAAREDPRYLNLLKRLGLY